MTSPTFKRLYARQDSRIVGTAVLAIKDEETGHLAALHVHRPYRGGGHGRRLLTRAVDTARDLGLSRLTLEVSPGANAFPLGAWYGRYGFERGEGRLMTLAFSTRRPHSPLS